MTVETDFIRREEDGVENKRKGLRRGILNRIYNLQFEKYFEKKR